jgi:hypothetical protein
MYEELPAKRNGLRAVIWRYLLEPIAVLVSLLDRRSPERQF